jgi:hypothetical protein
MKVSLHILTRLLAMLTLAASSLLVMAPASHAGASRGLALNDLSNPVAIDLGDTGGDTVAGVRYTHILRLWAIDSAFSLSTQRFPGYAAFSFDVGFADSSLPYAAELVVSADGTAVRTIDKREKEAVTHVVIPFQHASVIHLSLAPGSNPGLLLANPTILPRVLPGPSPSKTKVQLVPAAAAAGGQETVLVTTLPDAFVTLVIDYPDGLQTAVGPRRTDADGHLVYTWAVPVGVQGTVRVVAVGTGIATATFLIQ